MFGGGGGAGGGAGRDALAHRETSGHPLAKYRHRQPPPPPLGCFFRRFCTHATIVLTHDVLPHGACECNNAREVYKRVCDKLFLQSNRPKNFGEHFELSSTSSHELIRCMIPTRLEQSFLPSVTTLSLLRGVRRPVRPVCRALDSVDPTPHRSTSAMILMGTQNRGERESIVRTNSAMASPPALPMSFCHRFNTLCISFVPFFFRASHQNLQPSSPIRFCPSSTVNPLLI